MKRRCRRFDNKQWVKYYLDNIKITTIILDRYSRSDFIKSLEAKEFIKQSIFPLEQAVILLSREYEEMCEDVMVASEE